jgi:Domain of unknown function (DUF362)
VPKGATTTTFLAGYPLSFSIPLSIIITLALLSILGAIAAVAAEVDVKRKVAELTIAGLIMSIVSFLIGKLASTARAKNLFGCIATAKKAKYHKVLPSLLADLYEAVGGIDLSVLDGTFLWDGAGDFRTRMNTLIVGRDAVAVEAVGGIIAGLKPEKMPVLHEFVKRGLGEGDLRNIEITGTSLEALKPRFKQALKQLVKKNNLSAAVHLRLARFF